MFRKKFNFAAFFFASFILIFAVNGVAAGDKKPSDDAVAIVNQKRITKEEFDREFSQVLFSMKQQGKPVTDEEKPDLKKKVLDNYINVELLYQESITKGIKVEDETVDKQVEEIRNRFPDEKDYQKMLETLNMTEPALKTNIKRRLAIEKYIDTHIASKIDVTTKENKAFYDDHPEYFKKPEQVKASHILIKVEPGANEASKADAMKKITDVQKKLKDGKDFAELAGEFSEGPTKTRGGDLGYFSRGQMVKPFEDAAFSMEKGDVSDVVTTNFGYHLIKLTDKKPESTVTFEDVEEKIQQHLRKQKLGDSIKALTDQLRKDAKIEVF